MPEADFFISYTGKDRAWAEWIAWIIEEAGYTTIIQAWDFGAASNFVLKMQEAATDSSRTIAVITPDYFKAAFTKPEWAAAFADDPTSASRKLIPIRVLDFEPPVYFKAINYIDLFGLEESVAKKTLLRYLESIVKGTRLKPASKPSYPGATMTAPRVQPPVYPGQASKLPTRLTHNLPHAPNPFFTGRTQLLAELDAAFKPVNPGDAIAPVPLPRVIHGLGGVGKTQLVVQHATSHPGRYDFALWVGASSPSELDRNLAALTRPEALNLTDAAAATDQSVATRAVIDWLRGHDRWLLVLDNADTPEALHAVCDLLKSPGLPGHVLITSRRTDWPDVRFVKREVREMTPDTATRFLVRRTAAAQPACGTEQDAAAVAIDLGCLPLAMEQAAAYVLARRITFAQYRERLRASRQALLGFRAAGATEHGEPVSTTWHVSRQALSAPARAILRLLAFLAPDPVPRALFAAGGGVLTEAVSAMKSELMTAGAAKVDAPDSVTDEAVETALVELANYSLITLEPEAVGCHRLLQAVERDELPEAPRRAWLEFTLWLINDYLPSDPPPHDVRSWPRWEPARPHVTALVAMADEAGITTPTSRLMNELGLLLKNMAAWREAEPLLRRSLAINERSYGADHPEVAVPLNNLAQLLHDTNRSTEAEPLMRRALAIDEGRYGLEHPAVARDLNNLAQLLQDTNRSTEAEPLMRRALAINERIYGPDHPEVAVPLNNLAQLLQATDRLDEAEPLMRRALAIDERSYGPGHPHVAIRLNNLARLLHDTNRPGEAEPLMRRALAIDERSYGPDHPNVAIRFNNLARLLQDSNRGGEAEPLIRRALASDERNYGPDHPNVAIRLNNLARLLQATDRLNEAEPLMRRALLIFARSLGFEHPNAATVRRNYTALLEAKGRSQEQIQSEFDSLRQEIAAGSASEAT